MLFISCLLGLLTIRVFAQDFVYYSSIEGSDFDGNFTRNFKREADPVFHGHPKTQLEMWIRAFHGQTTAFDQIPSLINLLHMIATKYLHNCAIVILYDSAVENSEGLLLEQLLKKFPLAFFHGKINANNSITETTIMKTMTNQCVHYILFMADVMKSADVLGLQSVSKVVVVARSSQWRVQEFLFHKSSRNFVNLLVVSQSFRDDLALVKLFTLVLLSSK